MIRALALATALIAGSAQAQDCRLALILALDVSSSVDELEDRYQRQGLADAMVSDPVRRAFFSSPQPVALAVYEWSGVDHQQLLLGWRMIEAPDDLFDAARALRSSVRSNSKDPTALGEALGFAADLFSIGPDCLSRTIDVSGDGKNNDGIEPIDIYNSRPFGDIVVNGLAIKSVDTSFAAFTIVGVDIAAYYRNELIRGPGAFVEVAENYGDYQRAMQRKLERELSALSLSLHKETP